MSIVKAPNKYNKENVLVFLAGSIEMGKAVNWQEKFEKEIGNMKNVTVLNPRRDDWSSDWKQVKEDEKFNEQVSWELQAQEDADIIACYIDPQTKSPITLLELGLFHDKMIVCCPKGFYRKGNVDIVCDRYDVQQADTLEELVDKVKEEIDFISL